MNYYFDESGNWSAPWREENILVIGGIVIKNIDSLRQIERDIKHFQVTNNISIVHANEFDNTLREKFYRIIIKSINENDISILVRLFLPGLINRQTRKKADDVYLENSADLISSITFGDSMIDIEYDMKFHYAYPKNILRSINNNRPAYYRYMMGNYNLIDRAFDTQKERISKIIANALSRGKNIILENFLDRITQYDSKDENEIRKKISDYLWTELWLKIEGMERMREKFRDRILLNTEKTQKQLGLKERHPRLRLNFSSKQEQSAGVHLIDFICNLVYRYGTKPPESASSTVKEIYSKISVEKV